MDRWQKEQDVKLRKPWMIRLAARVGIPVLRFWARTLRSDIDAMGQHTDPRDPTLQERFIYALFHENLFAVPAFNSVAPVTALVSQSADGELLSQLCRGSELQTVRGSSSHGGLDAVHQILQLNRQSHVIVAPDGPRGPRREVKRGLIYLASWTQMPIVPLGIAFGRACRVNSWDRTVIPLPFSSLRVVGGPILRVPQGLGKKGMEECRQELERDMLTATDVAEAWVQGKTPRAVWPAPSLAA
ncbi:MAG: lysophospholipid acyltransferase family protein [Planctomycetes bacterium]|jgi:lysophospholipid acyltransferase (LPLAT)-like uncharacterized protein|nr:lysophospholipid acyltransferase family protein [Planctomycetota bacterium]